MIIGGKGGIRGVIEGGGWIKEEEWMKVGKEYGIGMVLRGVGDLKE